ncbi:QcrA and Rieske domain-containing protein [Archangium lansingense]|uniref:Rieske (2Fe-2S) protein n=1 Tax=Archangium lansingense TaxID=2995310 RepID=A0ABT4AQM1_9BACT|nr:Rieske (2Fe-2S) protein [Archangium lansinium]MCY1083139.1 Rieske (2Fe-2S) protein [Archangium lansinium]
MSTNRRGFLKGLAGASAGAAATGLAGCAPDISPAPVLDATEDNGRVVLMVSRYPELAREGGAVTLRVPDRPNVLVMHPQGTQYAVVSSLCTHRGCPLGFQEGEAICPCHLSRFAIDGRPTHPPATIPLTTFSSSYDSELDELTINFVAGEEGFPSVVDGKIFFPFTQFPQLRTAGGVVQGTPEGYGKLIFVFALDGGGYSAVDSICPHQGCGVGYQEASQLLRCPCHEARFSRTGAVLQMPNTGDTIGPIKTFTVTSDATGVTVEIV